MNSGDSVDDGKLSSMKYVRFTSVILFSSDKSLEMINSLCIILDNQIDIDAWNILEDYLKIVLFIEPTVISMIIASFIYE